MGMKVTLYLLILFFIYLIEAKCPCDSSPHCEYCKYCNYCKLCSLCDTACKEDSYIRGALEWMDQWKNTALSLLGEDTEIPDLDIVDNELEDISTTISKY